jgi:hypothetical protein
MGEDLLDVESLESHQGFHHLVEAVLVLGLVEELGQFVLAHGEHGHLSNWSTLQANRRLYHLHQSVVVGSARVGQFLDFEEVNWTDLGA